MRNLPSPPPSLTGSADPDTYIVTAPDGTTYEVQAPPNATEDDILDQAKKAHNAEAPQKMSAADEKAYLDLAADPRSTAADISGFLKSKGFGSDPKVVADFVAKRNRAKAGTTINGRVNYVLPKPPPRAPNTLRDNAVATAGEFVDGFLPGAAKTTRGIREVVLNAVRSPFTDEDFDPGAAYERGEDYMKRVQRNFQDEHPDASAGLRTAGFVDGMVVAPTAKVFKGASLAAGVGNGVVNGTAYGVLSGAMNDSGDGRVANTINGALFGGATAGTLPVLTNRAGALASAARRNIPGVDRVFSGLESIPGRLAGRGPGDPNGAANAQAERILGDMLPNGNISTGMGSPGLQATPGNIAEEVASRANIGVPAMPADVSDQGRRITSWALQGNGPMSQRARQLLSARQAQAGQRVRGHLADELGPAVDPIQEAEAITRRAQDAAGPAYADAYAAGSPMVITPELQSIMRTPSFRESLPQAYRNIQNRRGDPEALGLQFVPHDRLGDLPEGMPHMAMPEGVYTMGQQPSFEAFDQVVRTLNNSIPRSELTGRPILDNESGGVNDVMRTLDGYLKRTNEPYRVAKADFADDMAIKDAMERGGALPKLTGPEINAQLRSMPQHAQEAWLAGGRTALADVATNAGVTPTANVAQRVRQATGLSGAGDPALGDTAKLQAIETMSGRPGVINRLDQRLEGEDQAFKTFSESFGNSKTAPRQAMDDALSGEALQAGKHLLHGNIAGAVTSMLLKGNPQGTMRFKQAVQDRIAEIMTAANPQSAREALDAIVQRAQSDAQFRTLLHNAGIKPAALLSAQAASMDARAEPLEDPVDYTEDDLPEYWPR